MDPGGHVPPTWPLRLPVAKPVPTQVNPASGHVFRRSHRGGRSPLAAGGVARHVFSVW